MAFTYDNTDLASTLAQVRLEVGDTTSPGMLTDEEIQVKIDARAGDVLLAAADVCDLLATRFAAGYDFSADGQSFSRSQRTKMFADRARDLRARGEGGLNAVPTTRIDGYSEEVSSRDGAGGTNRSGRVRRGYFDPDLPY